MVTNPIRNADRYFSFEERKFPQLFFNVLSSVKNRYTNQLYHKPYKKAIKIEYIFAARRRFKS